MAIYVGILGVLIIIAGVIFSRPSDKKIDLQKLVYGVYFVLTGVFLLFWASLIRIGDGYVGIVNLGSKMQPEVLNSGWHLVTPLAKVIKLDTRSQFDKIVKKGNSYNTSNDTLKIVSADGSVIKIGLSVVYHVVPMNAAALYSETGVDYKDKLVDPLSFELARNETQKYMASSLSRAKWNELEANINNDIKSELRRHGLKVEKVYVSNFTSEHAIAVANETILAKMETKIPEVARPTINTHFTNKKAETKNTFSERVPHDIVVAEVKPDIKIIPGTDNPDELNSLKHSFADNRSKPDKNTASAPEETVANTEHNNNGDCQPMDDKSFGSAKKMILSTSDNTYKMLTTAQKVITTNCFTSEQVSDFVKLLPTEDSKLEFAKQAYLRTVDHNDFYKKVANNFDKKSKRRLGSYITHLIHRSGSRTNGDAQAGMMNAESEMFATAMDEKTFNYFKEMVSSSANDAMKLSVAKKIVNSHFLSSDQVLEIVKLFPETDTKLEFAKEAFARTTDKRMFVKVADYFDKNTRKMLDDYVITLYASR